MSLNARATWPRRARRTADFHLPPQIFSRCALSPRAFREGAARDRVRLHLRGADAAADFGPRGREFAARGAGVPNVERARIARESETREK